MKILVKNIEANPHRAIGKYPIDKAKVEALKTSIKNTSFWDNILVRQHPVKNGKYQLAYGHHRLVAIKALGIKEIDIPVRELDDAMMIKIMAEENLAWSQSPAVMIQTIDSVRKFLNAELKKCKTVKSAEAKFSSGIFPNDPARYAQLRKEGAGKRTIAKFLGGNWNVSKVEGAIAVLDDKNLSQDAVNKLPKMYNVGQFQKAVKENKVSKVDQQKIAEKIMEQEIGGRDISKIVEAFADEKFDSDIIDMLDNLEQVGEFRKAVDMADIPKAKQKKIAKTMVDNKISAIGIVANVLEQVKPKSKDKPEDPDVVQAKKLIEQIGNEADALDFKISKLDSFLQKLNVTELGGLEVSIAGMKLERLKNHILQIERRGQKVKQEQKQLVGYNLEI